MSIDWSKAPEGATHYRAPSRMYCDGFYRRESNGDWFFFVGSSWEFIESPDKSEAHPLIPRPSNLGEPEWDGEGRAPIGWKGEANNGGNSDYFEVEVVAHHFRTGREILKTEYNSLLMLTEKPDCWKLRPLRTQADLDMNELNAIIDSAMRSGDGDAASAIIAAGWKKER